MVEESGVVGDGGVEVSILGIGENGRRRLRCGGERIDLHAFAIVDGSLNVCLGVASEISPEKHVAAEGIGLKRYVVCRDFVFKIGRQDEISSAFALVIAEKAGVFERHLPGGDDVAVE